MATRGKQPVLATPTDLAYIAGFMDGEGSIGMYRKEPGQYKRHTYSTVQVTITQVDKKVLEYIQSRFLGSLTRKKTYSELHRPTHQLKWTTNDAITLLRAILPYLRVKKAQAETVIAFRQSIKLVDRRQHGSGGQGNPPKISDKEERRRKMFYDRVKSLNRTGRQPQRLSEKTPKGDAIV